MQLIIMCKAPVAGQVKTRLQPEFSAEQAAVIHRTMATGVIRQAVGLFPGLIIAADLPKHPFFESFKLPVVPQGEGTLGDRMTRLMNQHFTCNDDPLIFIGTDSPHMQSSRLQQAAKALEHAEVVLGPVEDGGYDLIGLANPHHTLFEDISWSSASVMQQTLQAIKLAKLSYKLLSTSFDIDTAADLRRAAELFDFGYEVGLR